MKEKYRSLKIFGFIIATLHYLRDKKTIKWFDPVLIYVYRGELVFKSSRIGIEKDLCTH